MQPPGKPVARYRWGSWASQMIQSCSKYDPERTRHRNQKAPYVVCAIMECMQISRYLPAKCRPCSWGICIQMNLGPGLDMCRKRITRPESRMLKKHPKKRRIWRGGVHLHMLGMSLVYSLYRLITCILSILLRKLNSTTVTTLRLED